MGEISPALYRAGEGEPLVLLHGFTGTWRHWRAVLGDLVPKYEVIAPTLAGHWGGPPFKKEIPGLLTLGDAADSLEEHLEVLGVDTAHVVGNSLGGALALELAKRGRARSVVALAPGGGWRVGDPGDEGKRLARFFKRQVWLAKKAERLAPRLMRRPLIRKLSLRDVMVHGELVPPADAVDLGRATARCELVPQVIEALKAGISIDGLEEVKAPTLVAWPSRDHILPMKLQAKRFREQIPDVEFRILEGVGHVPMWDDPRLIADTICEWVDKHLGEVPKPAAAVAS